MKTKLFLTSILLLTACAQTQTLSPITPQKITGLKTPESVVQGKDGRIYVSEIGEFGKDGDGQITAIDPAGKTSIFATGLNDPKGLKFIGDALYVADKTRIMKIDAKGKVSIFAAAEAFPAKPLFFNDLEADPQGNLYVSDSGDIFGDGHGGAIYKINAQGVVSAVINNTQDARVKAPNGLVSDDTGNNLLVVDFNSGILYSINQTTKAVTDLASGFGGGDGLLHHSSGDMYVSDWKNGKVFRLDTKGEVHLLKEGYKAAADLGMTHDEKYLLVPDMKAGELDFIQLK